MVKQTIVAVLAAFGSVTALAAPFSLANYQVTGNFALDRLNDTGWEASAVTYARDRIDPFTGRSGTLFFVGDEGLGVVEVSRTGQTIGTMAFSGWPSASTNHDSEGLTYIGSGVLVVAEERLQDAYRFTYSAGGSVNLATAAAVSIDVTVGNIGTEGISYDPRGGGSFVSVKQDNPQRVLAGTLDFVTGISTMAPLFDPDSLLGLGSLSDVQTLSVVDALAGTGQADNLLILSLDSRRLVEVTRSGSIASTFDLAPLFSANPNNIEGVTIDETGNIYLVAEHEQNPETENSRSRLIVLTPVAEPGTLALMFGGISLLGWRARRRG